MFTNYQDFILEQLLQESIVYFSPELRKKLKRTRTELGNDLLDLETKDVKDDISFFDVDKDGYISYNTMKNAVKFLQDTYPHLVDTVQNRVDRDLIDNIYSHDKNGNEKAPGIYTKSRNRIKFGRLINKLLPGKYSPQEIESFTNQWKSLLENVAEKIEVVEGEDIAYWYKSENYKEQKHTLGNSCMRGNREDTFRIYTLNPEVCKMLIITDGGELVARAIVWKPSYKSNANFEWFLDRQYTISDAYVNKMQDYAISQGWGYKTYNNHHSYGNVTWKEGEDTLVSKVIRMQVQLKPYDHPRNFDYERYPYVDTFRRYDPNTGILYNDDDQESGYYLLDDTSGGYTEAESGVYSEWHDETIPEDEAVYSDAVESYLWRDRAVVVERGSRRNRGWYPEGHDEITYDEYIDEYLHIDDTVYSEEYGHSILSDESCSIIYKIDSDGEPNKDESYVYCDDRDYIDLSDVSEMTWYKKLSDEWRNWEDGHTHQKVSKELLVKNYDGQWIPKIFKITLYPVSEENSYDIEYLSKIDARILDIQVASDNDIVMDKFKYNQDLEKVYPQLYNKAKEKIAEYEASPDEVDAVILQLTKERLEEIEEKRWIDWEASEED